MFLSLSLFFSLGFLDHLAPSLTGTCFNMHQIKFGQNEVISSRYSDLALLFPVEYANKWNYKDNTSCSHIQEL